MQYKKYFQLNQRSASGLTFKVDVGSRKAGEHVKAFVGNKQGHLYIWFKGRNIQVHRIVYELAYGEIPEGMVIDHINMKVTDNRPKNLRAITRSANRKNTAAKVGTYRRRKVVADDGTVSHKYEYIVTKNASLCTI